MTHTLELTLPLLCDFLTSHHYQVDNAPGVWNLLGVRAALPTSATHITTNENQPDRYNDTLVLFGRTTTTAETPLLQLFTASVDPGRYYTDAPMNLRKGCAHLMNGQYRYTIGTHRGYPALVEAAPVNIWRDANRNFTRQRDEESERGIFAIHIHAGGTATSIGRNSAGCQVIKGGRYGKPWTSFMHLVTRSREQKFWYTLTDACELIAFATHGGQLDADAEELTPAKRAALQQVLTGMAILYDYHAQAGLSGEDAQLFLALLNKMRQSGLLATMPLATRPQRPPAADVQEARATLLRGFRLIYDYLRDAGLDHRFQALLNQLRQEMPIP